MTLRPQRPSAEKTRQKILQAAKDRFLEKGFDGTSIKEIAQIAKVNTNLIFHHFTNKETLWNKVKDFLLGDNIPAPTYNTTSAKAFFKSIIDYRFNIYSSFPDFANLIKWEPLSRGETELISTQIYSPVHWLPMIKALQKKGKIIKSIDAKQMMLFIIFSSYAPFHQNIYAMDVKKIKHYKKMLLNMCCSEFCCT